MPMSPLPDRPIFERFVLGLLLATGLLWRIVYLLEYRAKSIFYDRPILDAQVYDQWAQEIASGQWLSGSVFHHGPMYPYLLAIFYRVFGHYFLPLFVLQALLGLGLLLLVYWIGRRYASAWVGLGAAILLLLYAPLPFFESKLMPTTLALVLSTAALAAMLETWSVGGRLRWLGTGLIIGLAALAHPGTLILAIVFMLAGLIRFRKLLEPLLLIAGVSIAISPATAHNFAAGGGFVPISAQGGITFLQGNIPDSKGLYRPVDGFTGSPLAQAQEQQMLAEQSVGHELTESEVSSFWFRQGLKQVRAHWIELLKFKLIRWISSYEYSTEYDLSLERRRIHSLWLPFLPFGFLAAAGGIGAWLSWQAFPRLRPALLYLIATAAPPLIFYVSSRYRIAVVPVLALLGAAALERLLIWFRNGSRLSAMAMLLVILGAGVLTLIPYDQNHIRQQANVHYSAGNLLSEDGQIDQAINSYQRALRLMPDFEASRINLGNIYATQGNYDKAIEQFSQLAARRPDSGRAYLKWSQALYKQGRIGQAVRQYRNAVRLGFLNQDLAIGLGIARPAVPYIVNLGDAQRWVEENPENTFALNAMGIGLIQAGQPDQANEAFQRAAAINPLSPDNLRAQISAAAIRLKDGNPEAATKHLRAILKVDPHNQWAQKELRRLNRGPKEAVTR